MANKVDFSGVKVEKVLGKYLVWDKDIIVNAGSRPQDRAFYNKVKNKLVELGLCQLPHP